MRGAGVVSGPGAPVSGHGDGTKDLDVGARMHVTQQQIDRIPGWFHRVDIAAFRVLLDSTRAEGSGDLAEMGVYMGKSAVLLGADLAPGETLTVADVFEGAGTDSHNEAENQLHYDTLTRASFERYYLSVHDTLPRIEQGDSWALGDLLEPGSHRFVHVDASHLYANVVRDLEAARRLLRPGGVVVCDDYRSQHTPGVAAAVWEAADTGLRPFLLTPSKFYGCFDGSDTVHREAVTRWLAGSSHVRHETQRIRDDDVVRAWIDPPRPGVSRFVPPVVLPGLKAARRRWRRAS